MLPCILPRASDCYPFSKVTSVVDDMRSRQCGCLRGIVGRAIVIARFAYVGIVPRQMDVRGFVAAVAATGLRETTHRTSASARLYPPGAHPGLPAGLCSRRMRLGAIGGQAGVIEIHPHLCE